MKTFYSMAVVATLLFSTSARADKSLLPHLPENGVCGVIGDGKVAPWMIDLAKTGNVVVHCIVPTEAAVQRIGKAADKAGVGGKLLAEAIPVSPLPYRDNLLNALIVQRPGAVDHEAGLKTVAPGGKLCVLGEDGEWAIETRLRPDGMDIWTHSYRDAGGNSGVSTDQFVKFPLGMRWNDDLPFNLRTKKENSNAWTNTRAIAVVDGRIYYVTNCARENLKRTATEMSEMKETQDMYLIARDSWNGTQLWRKKLGPIFYGGLIYTGRAPMVAMDDRVYAVNKEGQLLELEGATGEVLRSFETTYMTSHLMLIDGVLVAATWKDGDDVGAKTGIDRRPMDMAIKEGTIEAFDLKSGERIWKTENLATSIRGADGRVYLVERSGADEYEIAKTLKAKRRGEEVEGKEDRGAQTVIAIDLKKGEELWRVDSEILETTSVDHLAVGVAGLGGVAVSKNTYAITQSTDSSGREAIWLNGETGKVLVRKPNAGFPVLHENYIHLGGVAYDPTTGEIPDGIKGVNVGATVCTPMVYVNGITTKNRSNSYSVEGETGTKTFGAARGSCMFAAIPANGAFYTAQTYCACAPGTAPGFISFGPVHTEPGRDEVISGSALRKGPAYGQQTGTGAEGWFTYMGNAQRSNTDTTAKIPGGEVEVQWQKQIADPIADTNIEGSWKDSLAGLLTAPVVSGGLVFVADLNRHKLSMFGSADGGLVWETYTGGRVTTPPTVYDDLCLFGANDGYVYAIDKTEGALAWKLRMGPEERRMVSYAQLESPWPVFSSVLVAEDGIAYASAGRSTGAESGIVVRAFRPKTGEVLWSQVIAYREGRRAEHINDVMYLDGDALYLMKTVLDRKTGEPIDHPRASYEVELAEWTEARRAALRAGTPAPPMPVAPKGLPMHNHGIEGISSGNWTKLGDRRRRATEFEGMKAPVLAWDEQFVIGPGQLKERSSGKILWNSAGEDEQITAVVMGKSAVVFGGGLFSDDGSSKGFVRIVNRKTGVVSGRKTFPSPLSFQGLAIADGKVYATFENGSLVCLGSGE